jgi:hypothetical protein
VPDPVDPTGVERLIADYIDHLQDDEYVRGVFARDDVAVRVLGEMLGSGDRARVHAAALVLRDAALFRYVPRLWELLPQTDLFAVLESNLYASHYGIRRDSIFTLGKLTYPRQAAALSRAFPVYLERYPLELGALMGELFWLSSRERRRRWYYLDAVARAPHHLVRWSVFEAAGGWAAMGRHSRDARLYKRLLRRLAQDPHPFVRREARARLDGARLRSTGRRWDISVTAGGFASFEEVAMQFGNYLWVSRRADYDFSLLDRFAHYVVSGEAEAAVAAMAHRGEPFEWEAFVRAFDAWAEATGTGSP